MNEYTIEEITEAVVIEESGRCLAHSGPGWQCRLRDGHSAAHVWESESQPLPQSDRLKCFWCLVAVQGGEQGVVGDAQFIYNGMSCCLVHTNTRRGQPADYGQVRL